MASTISQNRPQSNINHILAPSPTRPSSTFSQDISRAIEASASMLPKYYTYKYESYTDTSSRSTAAIDSNNINIVDWDHHHQPPPPPPSPVGFPSSHTYPNWSALERKRV